jgi:hypothetical protein
MTLAQVQAGVAFLFGIVASLTGLLVAVALLLPNHAGMAERALDETPKRCFWRGMALLVILILGFIAIGNPLPLIKLVGFLMLMGVAGLITLGCAGMARLMGRRIGEMSGARSSLGCLVRGGLAYSIGVMFPIVGWWLLAPLSAVCAAGAGWISVRPTPRPEMVIPKGFEGQGAA